MSAPTLTSAVAVPFSWTSGGTDIVLTFASGASPVNVTVATGTYRMQLAPAATDFVRVVQNAINAALVGAGRAEVFTITMLPSSLIYVESTGVFTMALSDTFKTLGFSVGMSSALNATSTYPPANFATFIERVCADWSPKSAVAGAETNAGVGFGVYSGAWREEDEIAFGFIPRDPSTRASLSVNQTPWMPDAGSLVGAAMMPRQWTCRDVLETAGGKTCAMASGNLQTLLSSTSARYDIVTLPFAEIAAARKDRVRESWNAYFRWTSRWIRQSTQTGTRA